MSGEARSDSATRSSGEHDWCSLGRRHGSRRHGAVAGGILGRRCGCTRCTDVYRMQVEPFDGQLCRHAALASLPPLWLSLSPVLVPSPFPFSSLSQEDHSFSGAAEEERERVTRTGSPVYARSQLRWRGELRSTGVKKQKGPSWPLSPAKARKKDRAP